MAKSKLPSPSEAASDVDEDILESGRSRLRSALKRSGGKAFTYAASLFPHGTADTLLAELHEAGWNHKLVPDSRDGDYYDITPKRGR